jgi:hypothetical protein
MRRIVWLAIACLLIADRAPAQIDCGPNGSLCETTKYGLGNSPDFRNELSPTQANENSYNAAFFGPNIGGRSYYFTPGDPQSQNPTCGVPRNFFPYPGQILLRELTDCTPTSTGPICSGGTTPGAPCHIIPFTSPTTTSLGVWNNTVTPIECPGGGTCVEGPGTSCRVEIPIADGGGVPGGGGWTPSATNSDVLLPQVSVVRAGTPPVDNIINAHAGTTWGGSTHGYCGAGPFPLCRSDADCGGAPGSCTLKKGNCQGGPTPGAICSATAQCGTGGTCALVDCNPQNFRLKPSSGTRYLLPEARRIALGRAPGATYLRWDYGQIEFNDRVALNTALRSHSDSSTTCCAGSDTGCNTVISGSPPYPLLLQRTCAVSTLPTSRRHAFSTEDSLTADWIFEAGKGSAFYSDPVHLLPGQMVGHCANNGNIACSKPEVAALCPATPQQLTATSYRCCFAGPGQTHTCGNECAVAGVGGTCDFTEPGHRAQIVLQRTDFGEPRPSACASSLYVFRGTPNQGCTLVPFYVFPGDPGNDCGISNFGSERRDDADCDGFADTDPDGAGPLADIDLCPFLAEWDQDLDTDEDCGDPALPGFPGPRCRGDECECGDASANGEVNVSDITSANTQIFSGVNNRKCDANSDLICSVSDLIGINNEIFRPDSSSCRHITSARCGNNVVDFGEVCDDGARCTIGGAPTATPCDATGLNTCPIGQECRRIGGDGCNTSCRLE